MCIKSVHNDCTVKKRVMGKRLSNPECACWVYLEGMNVFSLTNVGKTDIDMYININNMSIHSYTSDVIVMSQFNSLLSAYNP